MWFRGHDARPPPPSSTVLTVLGMHDDRRLLCVVEAGQAKKLDWALGPDGCSLCSACDRPKVHYNKRDAWRGVEGVGEAHSMVLPRIQNPHILAKSFALSKIQRGVDVERHPHALRKSYPQRPGRRLVGFGRCLVEQG